MDLMMNTHSGFVALQVAKAKVLDTETRLSFSISCSDANDDDVEVPDVIVRIR
jgi:hypothetical protein